VVAATIRAPLRRGGSRPAPPRAAVLAAALAAGLIGDPAAARCFGTDLFQAYRSRSPETLDLVEEAARRMPYRRGLLFRLERPGAAPSHIFGTLHLPDPRVTAIPQAVRQALSSADTVALEIDLERKAAPLASDGAASFLRAPADRRADRLLARAELARLREMLTARDLPPAALSYKASVLSLMLSVPRCSARDRAGPGSLDVAIARLARERGGRVVELESLREQIEALDGLPLADERRLLQSTVARAGAMEDILETTILRYLDQDVGALVAWMRQAAPVPDAPLSQLPRAAADRLLTARTSRMFDRLRPLLDRGGVFVAVGAAHLPDEDGLLRLFERAGYRVVEAPIRP